MIFKYGGASTLMLVATKKGKIMIFKEGKRFRCAPSFNYCMYSEVPNRKQTGISKQGWKKFTK